MLFGPELADSAQYYELHREAPDAAIGFVVGLPPSADNSSTCSRVIIIRGDRSASGEPERKCNAPVQKVRSVREDNDIAAKAVLSTMGYTGPFTKEVRNAALMMIEIERNTLQRLERAKSTKPRKSRKPKKSEKS